MTETCRADWTNYMFIFPNAPMFKHLSPQTAPHHSPNAWDLNIEWKGSKCFQTARNIGYFCPDHPDHPVWKNRFVKMLDVQTVKVLKLSCVCHWLYFLVLFNLVMPHMCCHYLILVFCLSRFFCIACLSDFLCCFAAVLLKVVCQQICGKPNMQQKNNMITKQSPTIQTWSQTKWHHKTGLAKMDKAQLFKNPSTSHKCPPRQRWRSVITSCREHGPLHCINAT